LALAAAGRFFRDADVRAVFAPAAVLLAFFALVALARVALRFPALLAARLLFAGDFLLAGFFVAVFLADFRFFISSSYSAGSPAL
jgi:hypothetical protein